jgi:hypothetical protein
MKSENELLFEKHQGLAKVYAKSLFDSHKIGLEVQDLIQEFRIKLFTSIISYKESVRKEVERGVTTHLPIEIYLQTCLKRFKIDYISSITNSGSSYKQNTTIDYSPNYNIDYSVSNENIINVDFENLTVEINGYDIFQGLNTIEKRVYSLYLKGMEINKLHKTFGDVMNVKSFIKQRVEFMKSKKDCLLFEEKSKQLVHITALQES